MRSLSLPRALLIAMAALGCALSQASAEPQAAPQIVFNPPPGITQAFRVQYRVRHVPDPSAAPSDSLAVDYKLAVTPTREKEGFRLRLLVSEVQRPGGTEGGINMVVAAALMLDGFPFEMLVDGRGFLKEAADWPRLQRTLQQRADALPPSARGVARSVPDGHNAQQVAWHLARALDAMGFARSYIGFAKQFGVSTITWHGGTRVDVTVEQPDAQGGMAVTWALPSGARRESEGRGVIRRDGFVAPLTMSLMPGGGRHEIHAIEAIAAR